MRRLSDALRRDDRAEDQGMHADDRETCFQCQSWADHAHHPSTNARITIAEYREIKRRRGF